MNTDTHLKYAEKRISDILAELEAITGSVVRSISVKYIDVTKMEDERKQLFISVHIELERLPGTKWA